MLTLYHKTWAQTYYTLGVNKALRSAIKLWNIFYFIRHLSVKYYIPEGFSSEHVQTCSDFRVQSFYINCSSNNCYGFFEIVLPSPFKICYCYYKNISMQWVLTLVIKWSMEAWNKRCIPKYKAILSTMNRLVLLSKGKSIDGFARISFYFYKDDKTLSKTKLLPPTM